MAIGSLSARRAWIEIASSLDSILAGVSLSARRAWIEITRSWSKCWTTKVALRKESVDRNTMQLIILLCGLRVALRKESVDRNW